ncbi:hypothetical protein E1B28_007411 [Marasmius oreades]|nr:uncharacterized protein E1B28_007411 [Marasmius oreades]KAG7093762.1 hypothetical protein E1B28_007411 [Marasmius oreades]
MPTPSSSPNKRDRRRKTKMDGCETLYNLSLDCVRSKSNFSRCAAVAMQTRYVPVKRSPSSSPPPPISHLSSTHDPNNSPRGMHSTLAVQHIVPAYQHYQSPGNTFDESYRSNSYSSLNLESFPHPYNQYSSSSSGWSTPSTTEYVQHPAHVNSISHTTPVNHYPSTTFYNTSTVWDGASNPANTDDGLAVMPPPYAQYVDETPAYRDQYHHGNYGHPHAYAAEANRQISPVGSSEVVSPHQSSTHLSPPPHTPENYERQTPSPHVGALSSTSLQAPSITTHQRYYSHKEQLQFFRDALSLPFSISPSPFIPQSMYKPHTNSDRRRYVEEVELDEPIYFWAENPTECGISLADALHSRVRRLVGREDTVFEGRGPSVSIRLEWPGYRQWSRQIPTKDFRTPPGPITKAKLAKNVAKCVHRFILERQNQRLEDESDDNWRVGTGRGTIRLEDLILVSMHHVSMGSWQPQLRICRPQQMHHPGGSHWS